MKQLKIFESASCNIVMDDAAIRSFYLERAVKKILGEFVPVCDLGMK